MESVGIIVLDPKHCPPGAWRLFQGDIDSPSCLIPPVLNEFEEQKLLAPPL
jgi:hypothetical protein